MLFATIFGANILSFAVTLWAVILALIISKRNKSKGGLKRASQEANKTIRKR